jgi:hypothetical protein
VLRAEDSAGDTPARLNNDQGRHRRLLENSGAWSTDVPEFIDLAVTESITQSARCLGFGEAPLTTSLPLGNIRAKVSSISKTTHSNRQYFALLTQTPYTETNVNRPSGRLSPAVR